MMGETEEKWRDTVRRAIELEPDSVTIYQMELPYNTVISQEMIKKGVASPIADWATKRRWLELRFRAVSGARLRDRQRLHVLRQPRSPAGLFTPTRSGTAAT